jgi:LDH2 family malate/lactate/ureidoglycolate dehydrogenase
MGDVGGATVMVTAEAARRYCAAVFERAGLPARDAACVAEGLVDADLRGVTTHGLVRFPVYVERLRRGVVTAQPALRVVGGRGAAVVLDGDNGFGQVVAAEGMRRAVELARTHAVGVCAIRNSSHLGALAFIATLAVPHGMIGVAMSITQPVVAPWGGTLPKLGNNPFAVAVPAGDRPPIVLDMACSQVARGNLILASKLGRRIPPGWALDARGRPTQDPDAGLHGSLMPVGGHKGSGLALVIGILGGLLSGAPASPGCGDVLDMTRPQHFGHLVAAVDIAAFGPAPDFLAAVEEMARDVKATPCAEGVAEIFLPGEIEHGRRAAALLDGFPVSRPVLDEVRAAGAAFGVSWPA